MPVAIVIVCRIYVSGVCEVKPWTQIMDIYISGDSLLPSAPWAPEWRKWGKLVAGANVNKCGIIWCSYLIEKKNAMLQWW